MASNCSLIKLVSGDNSSSFQGIEQTLNNIKSDEQKNSEISEKKLPINISKRNMTSLRKSLYDLKYKQFLLILCDFDLVPQMHLNKSSNVRRLSFVIP